MFIYFDGGSLYCVFSPMVFLLFLWFYYVYYVVVFLLVLPGYFCDAFLCFLPDQGPLFC